MATPYVHKHQTHPCTETGEEKNCRVGDSPAQVLWTITLPAVLPLQHRLPVWAGFLQKF